MSTTEKKEATPEFRIDENLREVLNPVRDLQPLPEPDGPVEGGLPEPVFPQRPKSCGKPSGRTTASKPGVSGKGWAPHISSRASNLSNSAH